MKVGLILSHQDGRFRGVSALVMAVLLTLGVSLRVLGQEDNTYSTTAGSGEKYQTVIERTTSGELSQEDFRQVTVLASRVLLHLNEAVERLIDEQTDEAREQIEHAQNLAGIVREMLPVTTVKTHVEDSRGKTVYDYTEDVQDDRIPVYESTLMVEVVAPIIEAQKDEAALQGLQLQDADFICTSALLDLGYVERKLRRAAELLDDKEQALRQLVLAQTHGLKLTVSEEESPLVKAQAALQLAERMVGENKVEGAKANMQLARLYLESYQGLVSQSNTAAVKNLRQKIDDLSAALDKGGMGTETARDKSRGLIQGLWKTVQGWMTEQPGQARVTVEAEGQSDDSNTE